VKTNPLRRTRGDCKTARMFLRSIIRRKDGKIIATGASWRTGAWPTACGAEDPAVSGRDQTTPQQPGGVAAMEMVDGERSRQLALFPRIASHRGLRGAASAHDALELLRPRQWGGLLVSLGVVGAVAAG